jgi:hypothetical protein
MNKISYPLHLSPEDQSTEAYRMRLVLHAQMMRLNPNGWRKPRTSKKRKNARPAPRTWQISAWALAKLPTQASQ